MFQGCVVLLFCVLVGRVKSLPQVLANSDACPTYGCTLSRHFFSRSSIPKKPSIAWYHNYTSEITHGAIHCSSAPGTAICVHHEERGVIAYNVSSGDRVWATEDIRGNYNNMGNPTIMENGFALAGANNTFFVISIDSGFVNYENDVTSSLPKTKNNRNWGPYLIAGPGDNELALMIAPDGRTAVWNVELGMCWASMYMCPENDAVVCQVTPWKASGGWYLPSGSPAIVGNVAYFPARLQKGLSPEEDGRGAAMVAIETGDMADRLHVKWTVPFNRTSAYAVHTIGDMLVAFTSCHNLAASRCVGILGFNIQGEVPRLQWELSGYVEDVLPSERTTESFFALNEGDPKIFYTFLNSTLIQVSVETGKVFGARIFTDNYSSPMTSFLIVNNSGSTESSIGLSPLRTASLIISLEPTNKANQAPLLFALPIPFLKDSNIDDADSAWKLSLPSRPVDQVLPVSNAAGQAPENTMMIIGLEKGLIGVKEGQ